MSVQADQEGTVRIIKLTLTEDELQVLLDALYDAVATGHGRRARALLSRITAISGART